MAASATWTVSRYLLARLEQLGLRHLFAVPGDYASPFLLELEQWPGIRRVATVGELGCGYAADGYGRYAGIAAVSVQYGVGTFSLINCIAGAYVERVPVVVIAPSPSAQDRRITRREDVLFHHSTGDLSADRKAYRTVTVADVAIADGAHAPERIDAALVALLTARRPVYIEVEQSAWSLPCAEPAGTLAPQAPDLVAGAQGAACAAIVERMATARLPVLWAGVEVQRWGLADVLQELVAASGLPFTTTSLGKTVLDEAQPAFIGTYAGPASPALTRAVMAATDCPVALGTLITDDYLDIVAQEPAPGSPQPADYAVMVEATVDGVRVGWEHYHDVDFATLLRELAVAVRADPRFPRRVELPAVAPDPLPTVADGDALSYLAFYQTFGAFIGQELYREHTTLVLGESTSLYVFGNLGGLARDGFVAQAAWGSLGHETGCALGVALASGRRPWVVAGDGGFRMTCQELSSLAAAGVDAVVLVVANDAYAIEQAFVDIKAFDPGGAYAPFDLLPRWDYAALAQAFGARGLCARNVGELRVALATAAATRGQPVLIEVVIPASDLPPQLRRLATTP
jgi:indolepyruvate decarboxylase